MQANLTELEKRLWDAADELRANSGLKASEYASPVLGLIYEYFLAKFALADGQGAGGFFTPMSVVPLGPLRREPSPLARIGDLALWPGEDQGHGQAGESEPRRARFVRGCPGSQQLLRRPVQELQPL